MPARFVFLTDSHYYPGAPKDFAAPKMLTRGREVLDQTVDPINALKPDFIVHGGDLLCGGGSFDLPRDTYLKAISDIAEVYAGFEAPAYYIPGNHDCDAQEGSFAEVSSRFSMPDVLDVVDAAPRLRLALSNVYHNSNAVQDGGGKWSSELDDALRSADRSASRDSCALILVIHPWVLPSFETDKGMVHDAGKLLETLTECPSVCAVFTGHRHTNRITVYRDILVVDTACLIGFPLGFREVTLDDDGLFRSAFHMLDLPDLIQASYDRSPAEQNNLWQGELLDRDTEIFLPRLKAAWS